MTYDPKTAADALATLNILFRPQLTGALPPLDGHAFERFTRHSPEGFMPLGAYSYSNSVAGPIRSIGRYTSIAKNLRVMGASHPVSFASTSPVFYRARPNRLMGGSGRDLPDYAFRPQPVTIGNDVWIGQDVLLASGITVGDGAVIAAGAVVTKDVPPFAIMGGVPAQVIRMRHPEGLAGRLGGLAWWRFGLKALEGLDASAPERFADGVEERIAAGKIRPMKSDRRKAQDWLQEAGHV